MEKRKTDKRYASKSIKKVGYILLAEKVIP